MTIRRSIFMVLVFLTSSGRAQDTVQVKAGWNIVGSVKAGAVPDVLITIPDSLITSTYWGYTPGVGYESTDTLETGHGYWVKAKSDGLIVFNNAPPIDSCKSRAFIYQEKLYNTVKIGDQCWMAENLDIGTMVTGVTDQTDNDTTEKYCHNDDPLNCALYGGLYQWNEAMQYTTVPRIQGICPPGWHLPTLAEFQTLSSAVSGDGNALKTVGQGNPPDGEGTNTSGFSALLAGGRFSYGAFGHLGFGAYVWSSSENDPANAYSLGMGSANGNIDLYFNGKHFGFNVRCLKD